MLRFLLDGVQAAGSHSGSTLSCIDGWRKMKPSGIRMARGQALASNAVMPAFDTAVAGMERLLSAEAAT
jgi:hypothetical protein